MINGLEKGSSGTIIIPTNSNLNINTDDIVVEGILNTEFEDIYYDADLSKYRIVSVDDNRKGNLQHYKLGVLE